MGVGIGRGGRAGGVMEATDPIPLSLSAPFGGAKLALRFEDSLLVYRRDDFPDLPYPNCWDLPGGAR